MGLKLYTMLQDMTIQIRMGLWEVVGDRTEDIKELSINKNSP